MVPFVMVSGELNTDNTDATGFSQMAGVTDCPPETGATSEAEGVDCFPSFRSLFAKIRHKSGALRDRAR